MTVQAAQTCSVQMHLTFIIPHISVAKRLLIAYYWASTLLASAHYTICNGHILHVRKLRFKEVIKVAHGHVAISRTARIQTKA